MKRLRLFPLLDRLGGLFCVLALVSAGVATAQFVVDTDCVSATLLNPAATVGTYSVYVYDCGVKGTEFGCSYGRHNKVSTDVDFTVTGG